MTPKEYFMTAKEYLTELNRMCEMISPCCETCALSINNNKTQFSCNEFQRYEPDQAIAIVSEWSKAHPRKTYKDDFLEKFPKAKLEDDGQTPISYVEEIFGMYID